jgi:predicted RND superfamily exporter protein
MCRMRAILIGFAVLLCAGTGCSKDKKNTLRELTKEFDEMSDILATIKDRASYEQVKSELKIVVDARRERMAKAKERSDKMSAEEKERERKEYEELKSSPEYAKHQEAVKRYAVEMARIITQLPEVFALMSSEVRP